MKLEGKKFAFTFIVEMTHDRGMLSTTDQAVADWLTRFKRQGHLGNTLLVLHSDHGPRRESLRRTYTGKLEERLPFLAITLPESYKRSHPEAQRQLKANQDRLTTPHDLYATYVHMTGLYEYLNLYRIPGSSLLRGMSLLEPIPASRRCAEAGIEVHWCACVRWSNVSRHDPLYHRSAEALVQYINSLTSTGATRSLCATRYLRSIDYVLEQSPDTKLLRFRASLDNDHFIPGFHKEGVGHANKTTYSIKIVTGPGEGVYESTMFYIKAEDRFILDYRSISRVNSVTYKMGVRWIRTKKYQILSVILLISLIYYVISYRSIIMDGTEARRHHIEQLFAKRLEDALKEDMGTRCEMPKLDPFDKEIMQFYHKADKIQCPGFDWVRCELSTCKLRPEIIESHYNIVCKYRDIVFVTDKQSTMGAPVTVNGNDVYKLVKSDHVEVDCTGLRYEDNKPEKWFGYALGFRSSVSRVRPEPGREDTINVVMLGIDSTSKNGFIRNMPRTYKLLEEEFGAVIMDGYNILGDGTPATLFPLLTGKTELELPDRRRAVSKAYIDDFPFVFRRLQKDGYRTLYFEDSPTIGTFQYRFNGFEIQPADHYLRHFYLHANKHNKKHPYCIGDTPSYMLMMNKTEEFLRLDGKKFAFSFIADVTHDRIMLSAIDDDVSEWLMRFRNEGHGENTLLVVHADHGPRFAKERSTYIGKLEERLPFLAIMLPESYKRAHPKALDILKANKKMLTTPHDLYETYVEMLGLYGWKNLHKVPGSELPRGLSMLEPIPPTRTCAEAGIEAHWCACVKWVNVTSSDVLYARSAQALVDYINGYTEVARSQCAPRTLTSIDYVLRQAPNKRLLTFKLTKDSDGYVPDFNGHTETDKVTFTVKIAVAPGFGVYEATMTYLVKEDKFQLDYHSISRSNGYNNEPSCISATHPHLNMYCYCKQYLNTNT